jgi:hypothetical protein
MSATSLAPEAMAGIQAAQEELEQEAGRLTATGDPTAGAPAAYAAATKAVHRLLVDVFLKVQAQQEATDKLIQEGRKPWSRDEMRILINQLDQTLLHRWTQFNRAAVAIGVAVTLAFGASSAFGGWWWRGSPPVLQCADQPDGSRLCYTFVRPPTTGRAQR